MVNESHLQLLLDTLYCTQDSKFYYLKSVLWENIVQYIIRFMYLFCPKFSKNDSRKPFINKLSWTAYLMLYQLVHIIFRLIYMSWF